MADSPPTGARPPAPTLEAGSDAAASAKRAATATLVLLTLLNFLNYVDRYVLAAVLEPLSRDPAFIGITDRELGLLQLAFMGVYMIASPFTGALSRRVRRGHLIAAGVALWSLATAASGLARSYHELLFARALVGVGEASYATVAPAILSDLFPKDRRARVLSIFYVATPVGSALGFMVGGAAAAAWSWRGAFLVVSGPGLLLALLCLFLPDPRRGAQDGGSVVDGTLDRGVFGEVLGLLRNREWLRVTGGMVLMVFAVGGIAFWTPTYLQRARGLDVRSANLVFGGIAVVAGIIGTFAGGFISDAWTRRSPNSNANLRLSAYGVFVAAAFLVASPFAPTAPTYFVCAFFAELGIFLNTGPLNTALVNASPPAIREAAIGLNVLFIHLLGDAVSPPILGQTATILSHYNYPPGLALGLTLAGTAVPLVAGGAVLLIGLNGKARSAEQKT